MLLAFLAWAGIRQFQDDEFYHIFSGLTLGVHELGHLLFLPFGEVATVAGGSITQVAAPLIAGWLLYRQPDYFGVTVAGAWLASSLVNLSIYVADARALELPLVSIGGGDVEHDWNFLLDHFNILQYDLRIAGWIRLAAGVLLAASLLAGGWLCWQMHPRSEAPA
ncbi:MAG: hypothetical protein ACHQ2E_10630 [Gemmatimonadales bacterium]